ncbi:MAG: Lrp/AsnC family transcriptional regulator [Deltaproteobacteria bacterium]
MTNHINHKDKSVLRLVQGDIPLTSEPFASIAQELGISEETVLSLLTSLKETGVIKRFGALVKHQAAGFQQNAMVVWAIPDERIKEVGRQLATIAEISHCYERTPAFEGKYNIFSMIHLQTGDMQTFVQEIAKSLQIIDYQILASEQEFKKKSREYF